MKKYILLCLLLLIYSLRSETVQGSAHPVKQIPAYKGLALFLGQLGKSLITFPYYFSKVLSTKITPVPQWQRPIPFVTYEVRPKPKIDGLWAAINYAVVKEPENENDGNFRTETTDTIYKQPTGLTRQLIKIVAQEKMLEKDQKEQLIWEVERLLGINYTALNTSKHTQFIEKDGWIVKKPFNKMEIS